jgi:hypothetical protein
MQKFKVPMVAVLAVVLGACAEQGPIAPDAQFSNGVAGPGTGIVVSFTIPGAGTAGYWLGAGVDPATAPNRSCVEVEGVPGHFKNGSGIVSPNQNAGQCWVGGTTTEQTIRFTIYANHVMPKSGNEQLNFGTVCDPEDPDACSDVWVHYKKNSDWSNGKGALYGEGYFVHLSSIDITGNVIADRPIAVTACKAGGTAAECYGATLDW